MDAPGLAGATAPCYRDAQMSAAAATDLERRLREVTALNATLRALTSTLDLAEILRNVLERIKHVTSAEGLSLLLYDRERDELVFAATETLREHALLEPSSIEGQRLRCDQGIAGWVARHRESVLPWAAS